MSWEVIDGLQCELGESPVWDDDRLLLVDIPRQRLHMVTEGDVRTVELSRRVTAIAPAESGWLAIAGRTVCVLDLMTGEMRELVTIPGPDDVQLNDAVVGGDGRLYTGSVDRTDACRGELYAIDAHLQVTTLTGGIGASNGLDSTADGALVYADTYGDTVTVGLGGPTLAVRHPDGLTIDAEGGIWVASWGHGTLLRFTHDGVAVGEIAVPASNVSSVAFGGSELDRLYVTTARSDLDGSGGSVYVMRPGVRGLPPRRFPARLDD